MLLLTLAGENVAASAAVSASAAESDSGFVLQLLLYPSGEAVRATADAARLQGAVQAVEARSAAGVRGRESLQRDSAQLWTELERRAAATEELARARDAEAAALRN